MRLSVTNGLVGLMTLAFGAIACRGQQPPPEHPDYDPIDEAGHELKEEAGEATDEDAIAPEEDDALDEPGEDD